LNYIIQKIYDYYIKTGDSYLESITEVMKELQIDPEDMGKIIKSDKTLMGILTIECRDLKIIKSRFAKELGLTDLF
jgi:hypothetical protein